MLCSLDKNFNVSDNKKKIQGVIQFYSFTKYSVDVLDQMSRKYFMKSSFGLWLVHIFLTARGPCPLLSLLVNPRSQGLRPLQPMLAKSNLLLANIKQILIHFLYTRDQEKKWELQTFIWVLSITPAQISPNGLRYGRLVHRI